MSSIVMNGLHCSSLEPSPITIALLSLVILSLRCFREAHVINAVWQEWLLTVECHKGHISVVFCDKCYNAKGLIPNRLLGPVNWEWRLHTLCVMTHLSWNLSLPVKLAFALGLDLCWLKHTYPRLPLTSHTLLCSSVKSSVSHNPLLANIKDTSQTLLGA